MFGFRWVLRFFLSLCEWVRNARNAVSEQSNRSMAHASILTSNLLHVQNWRACYIYRTPLHGTRNKYTRFSPFLGMQPVSRRRENALGSWATMHTAVAFLLGPGQRYRLSAVVMNERTNFSRDAVPLQQQENGRKLWFTRKFG